jgi:hypothetical protein
LFYKKKATNFCENLQNLWNKYTIQKLFRENLFNLCERKQRANGKVQSAKNKMVKCKWQNGKCENKQI